MASEGPKQFGRFTKLPPELQNWIWRIAVQEESPRIYELCDGHHSNEIVIDIKHLCLHRESTILERNFLQVDQTSRKNNLRHYQRVQFSNGAVHMNVDIDSIYFGSLPKYLIYKFCSKCEDLLWIKKVKHVAWGMDQIDRLLRRADPRKYHDFDGKFALQQYLEKVQQQFPALETCSLVLDGLVGEPRRDLEYREKEDGVISFKDHSLVFWTDRSKYHRKWIMYLKEKWDIAVTDPGRKNMPPLTIRSMARCGLVRQPNWGIVDGLGLTLWSEWFHELRESESGAESTDSESEDDNTELEDDDDDTESDDGNTESDAENTESDDDNPDSDDDNPDSGDGNPRSVDNIADVDFESDSYIYSHPWAEEGSEDEDNGDSG